MVDFTSPYYPYEKVNSGYNSFKGAEQIPYKVLMYLLDLPDKNGYVPVDDNNRPRVRFIKYIWYDGANPLAERLPSETDKLSILFNGNEPTLNTDEQKKDHPKGYRLYSQEFWGQSQIDAQTTVKCYLGRVIPINPFKASIGIRFEILCNVNNETNTRTNAYARSYNIEQCIVEALNGVNITGVGTLDFSREAHSDNGSNPIADEGTNVGREVRMSLLWMDSEEALPTLFT